MIRPEVKGSTFFLTAEKLITLLTKNLGDIVADNLPHQA